MSDRKTSKASSGLDDAGNAGDKNVPDAVAPLPKSSDGGDMQQGHAQKGKLKLVNRRIGDGSPRLGMATLFPTEEDDARGKRAHERAMATLRAEKIDGAKFEWLQSSLKRVALFYGVALAQDERVTFSDIEKETARLQRDIKKLIRRIDLLSVNTREALNADVSRKSMSSDASYYDHLAELRARCAQIDKSCEPIASKANKKLSHQYRFQQCCAELWQVREKIVKRKLSETFEIHDDAFTTYDAAFIHAVMEAIAENVTASQVQEGLRKAAKAKRRRT